MHLDPLFLSRLQFAWVIAFHILLPAFTIGLASFIAVLEGAHFVTRKDIYLRISMFWVKIFAISFGMGVVSGIVMPFQFEVAPFIGAMGLFLISYLGIAISLFPMIVPHHFTLWQAASSPDTQTFLIVGTLFLLPIILMYTAWSYWVFRGKVKADVGYH